LELDYRFAFVYNHLQTIHWCELFDNLLEQTLFRTVWEVADA
jgi:hypothetical protein